MKGMQVCSNKGPGPLERGDNHKNVKMGWGHLKNYHWANFNQTWHKSFLGRGDSFDKVVQTKGITLLQGELIEKK
jgi:hypothetical protein